MSDVVDFARWNEGKETMSLIWANINSRDNRGDEFLQRMQDFRAGMSDYNCGCADCKSLETIRTEMDEYLSRWKQRLEKRIEEDGK